MSTRCLAALVACTVAACAADARRLGSEAIVEAAVPEARTMRLVEAASVSVAGGRCRPALQAGSLWYEEGRMEHGAVWKPLTQVLLFDVGHVHEAWLVLSEDRLAGIFLPVERRFLPCSDGTELSFEEVR